MKRLYWIHKDDWKDQEIIDEAYISAKSIFIKVRDPRGAIVYHSEPVPSPHPIPVLSK